MRQGAEHLRVVARHRQLDAELIWICHLLASKPVNCHCHVSLLREVGSGTNRPHVHGANHPAALTERHRSIPSATCAAIFDLSAFTAEATESWNRGGIFNRTTE
jgi:hypothetical protein